MTLLIFVVSGVCFVVDLIVVFSFSCFYIFFAGVSQEVFCCTGDRLKRRLTCKGTVKTLLLIYWLYVSTFPPLIHRYQNVGQSK